MKNSDSKRLVIDADVAQAAGSETATHPRAINCRDFLIQVQTQQHQLVLTKAISQEWKKHRSRFASKWRLSMEARKRTVSINPPEDHQLRNNIASTTSNADDVEVMQKDYHLLEAALDTDNSIISCDESVRTLYAKAAQQVGEIRKIVWVNPDKTEDEPIVWLKSGAPPEVHRQLSAYQVV